MKEPVRITRMGLPVNVELEHLFYDSISILLLVLVPLSSPIVIRYQSLSIKRHRLDRRVGFYGFHECRTFLGNSY